MCRSQELEDLLVFNLREILIMCGDRDKRIRPVVDIKVVDQRSYTIDGLSRSHRNAGKQMIDDAMGAVIAPWHTRRDRGGLIFW